MIADELSILVSSILSKLGVIFERGEYEFVVTMNIFKILNLPYVLQSKNKRKKYS